MHRFGEDDTEDRFRELVAEFARDSVSKLTEAYTIARHYRDPDDIPDDDEMDGIVAKARIDADACAFKACGNSLYIGEHARKFAVMTELVLERALEIIREAKDEAGG